MLQDFLSKYYDRVQTGLVLLIAFFALSLIDSFFLWWLVFGTLMFFSLYEALELYKLDKSSNDEDDLDDMLVYTLAGGLWFIALFVSNAHYLIFISLIAVGSLVAYDKEYNLSIIKPLLYPVAPFLFMLSLYDNYGTAYIVWLIVIVASCDIFAFFGGKMFGKTSFSETSPNKTLEGVFSGVGASIILSLFLAPSEIGFFATILITFFVGVFSVFGDLYESMLKRKAGVKDSGDLLPGHGGALDRLDGYLFGVVALFGMLQLVA